MGLTKKLHRAIDLLMGRLTGFYRSGYYTSPPADSGNQNENDHYVLPVAEIESRIASFTGDTPVAGTLAVMYWIKRFAHGVNNPLICDFGGGYGHDGFLIAKYHDQPFRYCVVEIPALVAQAKKVAALKEIEFREDTPPGVDILYSNGVVMNAREYLFAAIKEARPQSLIITAVECREGPTFYSYSILRKTGRKCLYITYNRAAFIAEIEGFGYALQGAWEIGPSGSGVFLDVADDIKYYGFAFRRRD